MFIKTLHKNYMNNSNKHNNKKKTFKVYTLLLYFKVNLIHKDEIKLYEKAN